MMKFQKGRRKTGGRQLGTPNKSTVSFRNSVRNVYEGLGGDAAFLQWAEENQTEFYRIESRLIPGEMREDGTDRYITVILPPRPSMPEARPLIIDRQAED